MGRALKALLLAACLLAPALAAAETVAVIVNMDNSQRYLSRDEVRRIYANAVLTWPDGTPIIIYDLSAADPVRATFSEKVLRKSPSKVAEEWAHLKITNQAKNPPTTVKSEALIVRRVSREKGAIGYVSLGSVRDSEEVRIVNTFQ